EYPSWPALPFTTTITENVETAGTVRLPHGKLTVESTPPGATVLLGGRAAGQTPLTLERVPAGAKKLTLQAKGFPPMELTITVEDRGDVKIGPQLGAGFPLLDPEALLRAVWVPDDPNRISPPIEGTIGPSKPRNDIIRNLHRKRLYEGWLRKSYRFAATVKSYDGNSGHVEFAEQKSELSRYRVLAILPAATRNDKDLAAALTKGATFTLYGRLSAVEEPRWPSRVITFEISPAEPLR
ncbi:MAG: PEGA domain-containing protein, partial [Opitutae bacterium]|nr:PEGA domain-containing protein [Opitutae bacterium]